MPAQAGAKVPPVLARGEAPESKPTISGNGYAAQENYDRAIAKYNDAIKLDLKYTIAYQHGSVTQSEMLDEADADVDVATTQAIQIHNSRNHAKLDRLADASEKKATALAPNEEGTEDKPTANETRAVKGWLGVSIRPVTEGAAQTLNVQPEYGALVASLNENSPAKPAGIEPGDVVVKFDGKEVKEWRDLPRIIADTPAGAHVAVTIIRKGRELTKTVKVGRLEDADKQASFTSTIESTLQEKPMRKKALGLDLSASAAVGRVTFGRRKTMAGP